MPEQEMTEQEIEAEFTPLNAAAFDYARTIARAEDTTLPCWLCLSAEAKQEYRTAFIAALGKQMCCIVPLSEKRAAEYLNKRNLQHHVQKWREAELERKQARDEGGNPHAFFMEYE